MTNEEAEARKTQATEQPTPPPPPTGVKLGDLNAIRQQYVTRAAFTLAAIGLVAASAGSIGQLLPSMHDIFPGAYPFLVYAAAVILPYAAWRDFRVVRMRTSLRRMLIERLASDKHHPDAVPPDLHRAFIDAIKFDDQELAYSHDALQDGTLRLIIQVYALIAFPLFSYFGGSTFGGPFGLVGHYLQSSNYDPLTYIASTFRITLESLAYYMLCGLAFVACRIRRRAQRVFAH